MNRASSALGPAVCALLAGAIGFAAASCGDKPKAPGCHGDKDCSAGLTCAANRCVECTNDSMCKDGKHCSAEDTCVAAAECTKDGDCTDGKVCHAGKCTTCATDDDCGPGGTCNAGACTRATKCAKDTDCADDEDCANGYCHKAGQPTTATAGCPLSTVYFSFDDSSIQQSERDRLDTSQKCIESTKGKSVYLIGHTDTSGTEEYNIALSERRAQTVADYIARLGTDPARLQVVPKGETEPTGLGDDKDRRVEIKWH
ncbi:MAG TPA: OmpA family protein [Kofleriaceae bacterium]|jgi:peptidoglycan-associated lipoprotein